MGQSPCVSLVSSNGSRSPRSPGWPSALHHAQIPLIVDANLTVRVRRKPRASARSARSARSGRRLKALRLCHLAQRRGDESKKNSSGPGTRQTPINKAIRMILPGGDLTTCKETLQRWRGRASSEHRDGIDGRARDVLETKGGYGEQELPAFALGTGPREILEIAVVDEPETHGNQGDDMEGVAERRVGQRRDVIVGVGADHGHAALAQPGAGGDVHRGRPRLHRMHGALRETPAAETRAHEEELARL